MTNKKSYRQTLWRHPIQFLQYIDMMNLWWLKEGKVKIYLLDNLMFMLKKQNSIFVHLPYLWQHNISFPIGECKLIDFKCSNNQAKATLWVVMWKFHSVRLQLSAQPSVIFRPSSHNKSQLQCSSGETCHQKFSLFVCFHFCLHIVAENVCRADRHLLKF